MKKSLLMPCHFFPQISLNTNIIIKVVGHGPRSDLIITPLDLQYYGRYTCKAVNPHGEAFFEIDLKEAREPSFVQQVTFGLI